MKLYGKLAFIAFIFSFSIIPVRAFTQESFDKIVMLNGDEHIGKVIEIEINYLKFIHKGETLEYSYAKKDINKIQFSSGRIEILNQVDDGKYENNNSGELQSHHNKIAVLPFSFISDGGGRDEKLEKKVQMDCYNVLKKFATQFSIQDPITTNALLIKNGVNNQTFEGFTPQELTHVLDVEYVVIGNVTILNKGTTTYQSLVSKGKRERESKKMVSILTNSGAISTTSEYKTEVDLQIFNDIGQNIFSKSHDSFWQTEDAYEMTLKYIIKRSPLYRK